MERAPNLWLLEPLAAEGKGAPHPGRVRASLWLPEPLAMEGKGAPRPWRGRTDLWMPGPLAAEGKGAQHPWGEAAKTAGCLARALRVLPIHSDICLQRPALPAAGLN